MTISPVLLIVMIAILAVFLVLGYFVGGRAAQGLAAKNLADSQSQWEGQLTQANQSLALSKQQISQLDAEKNSRLQEWKMLGEQLDSLRNIEKELRVRVGALEEKLEAEETRVHDRTKQLEESRLTVLRLEEAQSLLQGQLKTQSEKLGQAAEQARQLVEARSVLQQKEQDLERLRASLSAAETKIAELETASEKEREASEEKLRLLQDNKVQLTQEFQNLANQIFEAKQQSFSEQSRQGLDALLKPLKDQLESFRQRTDQIHTDTVHGQASMKTELEKLIQLNNQITTEASNLTRALKGDKKLQGTWGEQKVEFLLEQAGLRKEVEFEREANFKDEDEKDRRPDFVVHLPENKHIIVDSKVSLVAYTNYVAAETDEERAVALAAHLAAIRNHIDTLAAKKYPELEGLNSPDFVFMFMAIEPAYLLAAEHSPALFQSAYEKRIAIVTATTLLPVLRVVANLWSIQRQNQSTKILADQATRIHEKLRIFLGKMGRLGSQINTVHTTYVDTFKTLHEGKGSLTKIVDGFVDLGVKVVGRLPNSVTAQDDDGDESVFAEV